MRRFNLASAIVSIALSAGILTGYYASRPVNVQSLHAKSAGITRPILYSPAPEERGNEPQPKRAAAPLTPKPPVAKFQAPKTWECKERFLQGAPNSKSHAYGSVQQCGWM